MKQQTEPTTEDILTLEHALHLERRLGAGIFPRDGAQSAHFRKLCRFGMLQFDDFGRDIDGEVDRDVPIYKLTEQGRLWIVQRLKEENDGAPPMVRPRRKTA